MSKEFQQFSLDENKNLCFAVTEDKSDKKYFCPNCHDEMLLIKGEKKIHHFRHKNLQCAPESYIHKMGKNFIYNFLKNNKEITFFTEEKHPIQKELKTEYFNSENTKQRSFNFLLNNINNKINDLSEINDLILNSKNIDYIFDNFIYMILSNENFNKDLFDTLKFNPDSVSQTKKFLYNIFKYKQPIIDHYMKNGLNSHQKNIQNYNPNSKIDKNNYRKKKMFDSLFEEWELNKKNMRKMLLFYFSKLIKYDIYNYGYKQINTINYSHLLNIDIKEKKLIIKEILNIYNSLFSFSYNRDIGSVYKTVSLKNFIKNIYLDSEYYKGYLADVLIKTKYSKNPIFIEIAVTHKCEESKINSGIPIIEIELKNFNDLFHLYNGSYDLLKINYYNLSNLNESLLKIIPKVSLYSKAEHFFDFENERNYIERKRISIPNISDSNLINWNIVEDYKRLIYIIKQSLYFHENKFKNIYYYEYPFLLTDLFYKENLQHSVFKNIALKLQKSIINKIKNKENIENLLLNFTCLIEDKNILKKLSI